MASDSSNGPVSKALTSTLIASLVCLLSFSFRGAAEGQAQGQDGLVHTTASTEQFDSPSSNQLGDLIVTDPVLSELLLQEVIIAFDHQDYDAALQILDEMPASPAGEYYRGLCLLRTGNPAAAVSVLEAVRDNGQTPEELRLDASIALLKSGQPQMAAAELGDMLSSDPENGHARYFLGLAMYEQGDSESAREHIELAAQFDETLEPYRDAFRAYDQRLGAAALGSYKPLSISQSEPRQWNLSFLTGFEYDSNVPLTPVFSGLGGNIEREDSRMVVGLFGDYRFIQDSDEVVGVTGSAYTNFHFDLDQFDVQTYSTSAYWNRAFGDWIAGVTYSFGETLLDRNQFATSHRLAGSVTKRWEQSGHTTGFYEYEYLDLAGLSLIPAQNRTGHTNSAGFTQAWYIGPQNLGRIYAGYRFDNTDAYGSDFDMNSHMLNARIEYPVFQDLVVDAEARQFWDEYSNGNSLDFFERSREDQRLELRAGIQKYIDQNTSLRFDYTYVDSDSNVANLFGVDFYSYQKHVLSALLIYDF
ncbi:MAG: tetratricopeptide repeat protein [Planctomycetaceae bacterium]|nr:tetratricopeptide repeat protein [Planctomycetaceae bacterium]